MISLIPERRRNGIVKAHPNVDPGGKQSIVLGSSIIGGVIGGLGILKGKGTPASRALASIGGAYVLGSLALSSKEKDPSSVILGMTVAGAAAAAAYSFVSKSKFLGLKTLSETLQRQGPKQSVEKAINAVRDLSNKFPGISNLLSREGAAIGAGLATIPMAHSLMVKYFAHYNRKTSDHGDVSFLPAWQDNKAGSTGFRKTNGPLFGYNQGLASQVNFSGSIKSYYNTSSMNNLL